MNSRPLISTDTPTEDGVAPLTPEHFLVGGCLADLPAKPKAFPPMTSLRRWNFVQRLNHDLWQRWKTDYLVHLQWRNKWKTPNKEFQAGYVVLLIDTDANQRSWPMGRVTHVYPGTDGHVSVVDVKIQGKTFRRPVHSLVYLLREEEEDSSLRGEDFHAN